MLQDIVQTFLALVLLPLFILAPGYVIGWAGNLLDFRSRRLITRLLLGTVLSVAVVPAFTYLVARITHLQTLWWIFVPFWFSFFWLILPDLRSIKLPQERWTRWAIGLTLFWVILAIFSLIDLQFDQELFFNVVAFDWSHRVAITDTISRTGIPPVNPFFFPGEPVYVSYYYFWSIIPALLTQLMGGVISSRIAFLAASIWCGVALRAVAALYLRFQGSEGKTEIGSRSASAFFLFFITGLDIIFIAILLTKVPDFPGIAEAWNSSSEITSWTDLTFWVPNHLGSLIACITSFLIIQSITPQTTTRKRIILCALAGIGLTSALGMSIYVILVFAAFWGLWFLMTLIMKDLRFKAIWLVLAGLFGLIFAFPFLFDTWNNREITSTGASLFSLGIRPIFIIESSSLVQNVIHSQFWLNLIHFIFLPVNYFIELGFFMLASLLYIQSMYKDSKARQYLKIDLLLLLTSLFICSFLKSTIIPNNDLGWRGILPAQFILLIWSANALPGILSHVSGKLKPTQALPISKSVQFALLLTFLIGLSSTLFDLFHLRFFFVMYDKQVWLTSQGGVYPPRDFGGEIYSLRQTYQFINDEYPKDFKIQNNPTVPDIDLPQGLYADRQSVVAGLGATTYGVPQNEYHAFADLISPIFLDPTIPSGTVKSLCTHYSIDLIIVIKNDPVWSEPKSWIWLQQPVFETSHTRVFLCETIR